VGSVGLYRRTPGALTESDVATATVMAAAVVGVAVQLATAGADDHSASESTLAPAMRREVHQATGMIVVQLETTATVAFSRLRAYAFANERTVMDVAHAVVTRQLDFRSVPE
jgi:AmiR/NasT family two-component response regulator